MKPVVTIIGRPNVGKSTLFNRLAGKRKALVSKFKGFTRDRNYADVNFRNNDFSHYAVSWRKRGLSNLCFQPSVCFLSVFC